MALAGQSVGPASDRTGAGFAEAILCTDPGQRGGYPPSYTRLMILADGSSSYELGESLGASAFWGAAGLLLAWGLIIAWRERRPRKAEDEVSFRRRNRRISLSFLAAGILWPILSIGFALLLES